MFTDNEIQVLRDMSVQIINPVQEYIIRDICERIAHAGGITATAEYLTFRAETLGLHWDVLKREIAKRLAISVSDVSRLYKMAAERSYSNEVKTFGGNYISFEDNTVIQLMVRSASELAENELFNITQTQAIGMITPTGQELPLREFYANTMDFVFNNVSYGVMDYNTAIRYASTELAKTGATAINYASKVRTSLEAAVRRNIMGGLGLLTEQISQHNHDALGANGWEMSAHAMSAPDHEPHQGKQYSDEEWMELNGTAENPGTLIRRIGTLNCGHNAFPIILGIHRPQYTARQLQQFKDDNDKGVTIGDKHYTLYEATQALRAMERSIRQWKRRNTAAEASGDSEQAGVVRARLVRAYQRYREFSKMAGLRTQEDRLYASNFQKIA